MNKNYEDLMRWTMNDIRDLDKLEKRLVKKSFDDYLMNTVMNLDMFGVISNNTEYLNFKSDLVKRMRA